MVYIFLESYHELPEQQILSRKTDLKTLEKRQEWGANYHVFRTRNRMHEYEMFYHVSQTTNTNLAGDPRKCRPVIVQLESCRISVESTRLKRRKP